MSDEAFVPRLPPWDDLTEADHRWLGMRYHRLRNLSPLVLGTFAEPVVAELLPGSLEAPAGAARVDIEWTPSGAAKAIGVEVKASRNDRWDVSEHNAREGGVRVLRRRADVYVLARHEGNDHREGWTFFVVPCWRLDGWGRSSISRSRLRNWDIREVDGDELEAAVLVASSTPSNTDHIIKRDSDRRRLRRSTGTKSQAPNPGTNLAGRKPARPTAR
jgi:hypothetical protein